MKKVMIVLLVLMMVLGLVGCGSSSNSSNGLSSFELEDIAEQAAINACCREEGDSSIAGFEVVTISKYYPSNGEQYVYPEIKGRWLKKDDYGMSEGWYTFDFSCRIDVYTGDVSNVDFSCRRG